MLRSLSGATLALAAMSIALVAVRPGVAADWGAPRMTPR